MDIQKNLDTVFAHLENMFKTKTVIGDPIVIGEVTLVPVVNVTFGIGTGGGEGKDEKDRGGGGMGAGTGAKITPAAVIVIKGSEVSMLPVAGRSSLENIIGMAPEVINQIKEAVKKETKEEKKEKEEKETGNSSPSLEL